MSDWQDIAEEITMEKDDFLGEDIIFIPQYGDQEYLLTGSYEGLNIDHVDMEGQIPTLYVNKKEFYHALAPMPSQGDYIIVESTGESFYIMNEVIDDGFSEYKLDLMKEEQA